MKQRIHAVLAAALVLSLAAVAAVTTAQGWGAKESLSSTTAVQTEFSPAATMLSVFNQGAGDVYVMVNCTSNEFEAAVVAGTAIVLPPSSAVTLNRPDRVIQSYWRRSSSTVNTVYSTAF